MPFPIATIPAAVSVIGFFAKRKALPINGTSSIIALEFFAKLNFKLFNLVCISFTPLKVSLFA